MNDQKPCVLSIAGLDPCGGAGLLADIKVFEKHRVQGMAVCTSLTFQNENEFSGLSWVPVEDIKKQLDVLWRKYNFEYVKIGLVAGLKELEEIIDYLREKKEGIRIVWDPIMKASAGYEFHQQVEQDRFVRIMQKIYLLVPNIPEIELLNPDGVTPVISARKLSKHGHILLKGGHSNSDKAEDILFDREKEYVFSQERIAGGEKHGSGCVLSAAILANLAKGYPLVESCRKAKNYTTDFLSGSKGLLGYHYH